MRRNGPRPPKLSVLLDRCSRWNGKHPIGSEVWYHPVIGPYTTRTAAEVLSGHTPVVWLTGFSGCVALEALTDDCSIGLSRSSLERIDAELAEIMLAYGLQEGIVIHNGRRYRVTPRRPVTPHRPYEITALDGEPESGL